jgi:hypothetical protein
VEWSSYVGGVGFLPWESFPGTLQNEYQFWGRKPLQIQYFQAHTMIQLCRWWFSCLKSFHICF